MIIGGYLYSFFINNEIFQMIGKISIFIPFIFLASFNIYGVLNFSSEE